MSKEFVDNRIDTAHGLIDEGNPLGAITLLKNLKLRVHNNEVAKEIQKFEENTDNEIETEMRIIEKSERDELRKEDDKRKKVMEWAKTYLDFYDRMSKEHELR